MTDKIDYSKNTFELWVSIVDPLEFMQVVVELSAKGATILEGSMPRLRGTPLEIKMTVDSSKTKFLDEDIIGVVEIPKKIFYSRDDLEDMTFDEFRTACKYVDVIGRDRNQMMREYMALVHKQEEELAKPSVTGQKGTPKKGSGGSK